MNKSNINFLILLFSALNITLIQADETEYSLYLEAASDDADTDRYYSELTVINNDHLFAIGVDITRVPEIPTDLSANGYNVSYNYQLNTAWDLGASYERWGTDQRILADTLNINIGLKTDNWQFLLSPEYRNIKIYSQARNNRRVSRSFHSTTVGVDAWYYGFDPFEISVGGKKYDYSIDTRIFTNPAAGRVLSLQALLYTRGLTDYYYSYELAYNFPHQRIGIERTRIESAVDEEHSDVTSLRLNYFSQTNWILTLEAGQTEASSGGDLTYGLVGINFNW